MTEAARQARNAYRRNWYAKNKDKAREQINRYWEKKASQAAAKEAEPIPGQMEMTPAE